MDKTFHFLSGLPRTGSTLLSAILNQNPAVYVTPTSPLMGLLVRNQDAFWKLDEVVANPIPEQLVNISRGMIEGAWAHRPEPIIIDKHRGWGKNMVSSTVVFGKEIKIIVTVRDLPSIMASWMTLIRKNPERLNAKLVEMGREPTEENWMSYMWFETTKDCVEAVVMARKTAGNRCFIVHYDDLVSDPEGSIDAVAEFLELPVHFYDFSYIRSEPSDDLAAYGFADLHSVRPTVSKIAQHPVDVLGKDLYKIFVDLERQYGYR